MGSRAEHDRGEVEDGDLPVVEEGADPPDGEIVAASLDGGSEVTVKMLCREGSKVRLKTQNGGHDDIIVPVEDVRIRGRVAYVVHSPVR